MNTPRMPQGAIAPSLGGGLGSTRGWLVCCAIALAGCADQPARHVTLDVETWWRKTSEDAAFASVRTMYEQAHPNVTVNNASDPNADNARELMAEHLLAGAPPSTYQANIGADLQRWTIVDTDGRAPSQSRILPLGDLYGRLGLDDQLPAPLLDAVRVGSNQPFGVPINIHRLNVLYYNVAGFEKFAQDHPGQSLDSIDTLCPNTPSSAKLDANIAVGTRDSWVLGLLTFENVLVALAGPDVYEGLFRGSPVASSPSSDWQTDVQKALVCVKNLSRSFLSNSDLNTNDDWADAAHRVGKAKRNSRSWAIG